MQEVKFKQWFGMVVEGFLNKNSEFGVKIVSASTIIYSTACNSK